MLGGHVEKIFERNGEWTAVLRFDRSYEARLRVDVQPTHTDAQPTLSSATE
jgi:hypothetical protein